MQDFIFQTTPNLICQKGGLSKLPEFCAAHDMKNIIIITDQGLVDTGIIGRAEAYLKAAGVTVSIASNIEADPPVHVVKEAVESAKDNGVDGIIGIGGGSSMDTAKLVALLCCSDEKLEDIYGIDQVKGERLPLILIPTTAGTGSEVTPVSVITTGPKTKVAVISTTLLPDVALLDAELTVGLPPHITAATGIDAMVHAIESYTSAIRKNPLSDVLGKAALGLLSKNILAAVHHGDQLEARENMLLGACIAGQAFANAPVGAIHALAYPLGAIYHIPHGLGNSLVMPGVLRFNHSAAAEMYAELLPHTFPDITPSKDPADAAHQFIDAMASLSKATGLPIRLRDAGVPEDALPVLAEASMLQERLIVNNPRPVTEADALEIYREAW